MFINSSNEEAILQPHIHTNEKHEYIKMLSIAIDVRMVTADSGTSITSMDRPNMIVLLTDMRDRYEESIDPIDSDSNQIKRFFISLTNEIVNELKTNTHSVVLQVVAMIVYRKLFEYLSPVERFALTTIVRYPTKETWIASFRKIGVIQ